MDGDRAIVNPEDVDVHAAKHQGQIALRKLYHESPRVIVVLYTAQSCGPCRTLKPIVHSVIDEYKEQVRFTIALMRVKARQTHPAVRVVRCHWR